MVNGFMFSIKYMWPNHTLSLMGQCSKYILKSINELNQEDTREEYPVHLNLIYCIGSNLAQTAILFPVLNYRDCVYPQVGSLSWLTEQPSKSGLGINSINQLLIPQKYFQNELQLSWACMSLQVTYVGKIVHHSNSKVYS